ncbi:MAG: DUF1501 domain-containing protein [Aeoliella sp.]
MSCNASSQVLSRREWMKVGSCAAGSLLLTGMVPSRGAASVLAPRAPHFAPKAKRVIFMFINGGPSQQESFDYKPELAVRAGEIGSKKQKLLAPLYKFKRHGECGMWVSEAFPHLAQQVDHLCMLNGMHGPSRAHPIAIPYLHTGEFKFARPSIGSWVLHGLGTENQDLPGYFTIKPTRTFGGPSNYGSAFLPTTLQATRVGWEGQSWKDITIPNLTPGHAMPPDATRDALELAQNMNRELLAQADEVQGVIDSLDLSQRMEQAVPEVIDLGRETKTTLANYGIDDGSTDDFGRQCLLARRLVESGVRFVEISSHGWDHHSGLDNFKGKAAQIDKPIAALLEDLAQRGLLEETLVLWTGEFGREPETQILEGKEAFGRDHNAEGYTAWLAGGGVRAGLTHGATDELGYKAVEGQVHLHDLHATMLHLLGLDHKRLTYRYGGRDFRLTDVHGNVVHEIIA